MLHGLMLKVWKTWKGIIQYIIKSNSGVTAATTHSVPYPSVRCLIHTIIHRFICFEKEEGRRVVSSTGGSGLVRGGQMEEPGRMK